MTMFIDEFEKLKSEEIRNIIDQTTSSLIKNVINKERLNYKDFLHLLSPLAEEFLDDMAVRSKKITDKFFCKNIQLYIPMYISNECSNICLYCGFSAKNKIKRKTLTYDEVEAEFRRVGSDDPYRHSAMNCAWQHCAGRRCDRQGLHPRDACRHVSRRRSS